MDGLPVLPSPNQPMDVARTLVGSRYADPTDKLMLRAWRGGWWTWNTSHWTEVDPSVVRADAYRFTEGAVYTIKDETRPWAPNRRKVADLLEALAAVTHTTATEVPTWIKGGAVPANEIVACSNGLLHVPTRHLLPHDAHYFNQVAVPFAYAADAPQPERWLAFLDELWPGDPDSITALQEFFGYVISGRTDQHKILLLIGPTRAGKGVIGRVLKALVGRGNHAGPTLASLGTNFGLAPLIGKPLAIVSDARLGSGNVHQIVERLLSVSGEDMLTIDIKFREAWTGTLPTRFLVISNELPRFGDASGAIANRFIVLTMSQSWLGREDTALTDKLVKELPGIFSWALDGLAALAARNRFTEPQSSVDAVLALQDLVSPVAAFVRDRCQRGPYEAPVDVVWSAWKAWADDNGHKPGNKQWFGRDLRAVIPGLRVVQKGDGDSRLRVYRGIEMQTHSADLRVYARAAEGDEGSHTRIHAHFPIVGPPDGGISETNGSATHQAVFDDESVVVDLAGDQLDDIYRDTVTEEVGR
jgi:putative DNA primase/helicase